MTPLMLLGILILVPIVIAVLLRINAAVLFMSLCVGAVLVQFVAGHTGSFTTSLAGHNTSISESTIRLGLLLIPAALTAIFLFHSVKGGMKTIWNVFPAIGVGLLTALLVKPLLSPAYQATLERSTLWHQLSKAQALVVSISALFSLLFLWIQRQGSHDRKHNSKRYHA